MRDCTARHLGASEPRSWEQKVKGGRVSIAVDSLPGRGASGISAGKPADRDDSDCLPGK